MKKDKEILEEYFLERTEKTDDDLKGWKVVGSINDGKTSGGSSTWVELKTINNDEGFWLIDFKIKILYCGLVLVSPNSLVDEELVMEAVKEYSKTLTSLSEALEELLKKSVDVYPSTNPSPYWTCTNPNSPYWTSNSITCSSCSGGIYDTVTTASSYNTSATC